MKKWMVIIKPNISNITFTSTRVVVFPQTKTTFRSKTSPWNITTSRGTRK